MNIEVKATVLPQENKKSFIKLVVWKDDKIIDSHLDTNLDKGYTNEEVKLYFGK